jgi:heme A synthase
MSLRAFHIIFVVVTVVLSLFVALWGIRQYSLERNVEALVLGLIFLVTAVGLMVYGKKAYGKLKELP